MSRAAGPERLCRPVRKSDRFELIGEQHALIFLYDFVDDKHDQLAQCRRRRGRYHNRPGFTQFETQNESLFQAYARRSIRQGREEGGENESTYVCKYSTVNGGEVGDEREESGGP